MSSATTESEQRKEQYGDPIRFRLASEYWRIMDDLQPRVLAALEYLAQTKQIDQEWRETVSELGKAIYELKWSIDGFKNLLTKEDGDSIRKYEECHQSSLKRSGRVGIASGKMDGRAELLAKYRLALEDTACALYFQTLDIRTIAFKNNMWDMSNRPKTRDHGVRMKS